MKSKIGAEKLDHWLAQTPPAIATQPCKRTGGNTKIFQEYWWDESTEFTIHHDLNESKNAANGERCQRNQRSPQKESKKH